MTQEDLLRLRRRYPKIASRLLWNLNDVFADHLSNTMDKLQAALTGAGRAAAPAVRDGV
jgi:hypothetical protein